MARPVYPTSEQIWTKAKAYKSTYFDDQNAILKDSIERARKQLVDKYNANLTYTGYQKDLVEMYGNNVAAMQDGLNEYEKNKIPGKDGGSGAAALLKIVADVSGNEQDTSIQRNRLVLDAQGQAEAGYNLSPAQSNAIGDASSLKGVDLNNVNDAQKMQTVIDNAVGAIPGGTFAPNADSSKTATSQLYAAMSAKLGASPIFRTDPAMQAYLQQKIVDKMGVEAGFIKLENVEADKKIRMKKQGDIAGSVGGIALGREAAKLAMDELNKNRTKKLDADDQTRIDEFMNSKYGQEYKRQIELGKTMPDAAIAVNNIITKDMGGANEASDFAKLKFANDIALTQNALSQGGDFDVYKYFDPVYTEKLAALKATQGKQTTAEQNFALGVTGLGDVPTEQQARRLGAEINRPLEPGYGKYLPEAQAALLNAQRTGTMRAPLLDKAGNPFRSPDDFLASRLMPPQPAAKQLSDAERITQLASRRAVAESPAFDYEGSRVGDGFGLYNKVKGKSLEGGNTKENIVKAAAALAGDDQAKRDDILRDYYMYALKDMRALKPQTITSPDPEDPDENGNRP